MTGDNVPSRELDRLDAVWDDMNRGRLNQGQGKGAADAAALMALAALVDVPPPSGERIWGRASAQAGRPDHWARQGAAAPEDRPRHLAAPSAPGWSWLPAAVIAVAASLTILGGIFFSGNDGDDVTRPHPNDASSVVATLASTAPVWATPGGEVVD